MSIKIKAKHRNGPVASVAANNDPEIGTFGPTMERVGKRWRGSPSDEAKAETETNGRGNAIRPCLSVSHSSLPKQCSAFGRLLMCWFTTKKIANVKEIVPV